MLRRKARASSCFFAPEPLTPGPLPLNLQFSSWSPPDESAECQHGQGFPSDIHDDPH